MSDFLHNLRTGNIKRFDRPRKNYDNPQYRHPHDRQHNKDRKGNYHKKAHTGEQLQEIKKHIEGMAKTIEENFKVQERAASALERIAAVLENSDRIGPALDPAPRKSPTASQPVKEENEEPQPAASNTQADLLTLIRNMRSEGATFEKIAGQLEKRQVPTISGRGKWRGPAVSKLLKENS